MKPHPRIRRTVKWGGLMVTVLLVALWIGSCVGWFQTFDPEVGTLTVWSGRIELVSYIYTGDEPWWPNYGCGLSHAPVRWWFDVDRSNPIEHYVCPLWLPVVPFAIPTVLAWRSDIRARRRALRNHCPACCYDRAGLPPGAVCPECGSTAVRV